MSCFPVSVERQQTLLEQVKQGTDFTSCSSYKISYNVGKKCYVNIIYQRIESGRYILGWNAFCLKDIDNSVSDKFP